jgi:general secretion pathway protein J
MASRDGFTLIEIIIAISIFAIVIGTIVSAYFAIFSKTDVIHAELNEINLLQSSLKRMAKDIKSLYVALPPAYSPPTVNDPPDDYRVVGDATFIDGESYSTLRFTSTEHLPMNGSQQKGVAEIVYFVQKTEQDGMVLRRADHLYPFPEFNPSGKSPALAKNIQSLNFRYYDQEGNAFERWDSDADDFGYATPRAIEINIGLPGDPQPNLFGIKIALPIFREGKVQK